MSIDIFQKIETALKQDLPGESAQLKLYPEKRPVGQAQEKTKNAAVLILLYPNTQQELNILFIKRPKYSGHHSAQVSFPGGQVEPCDKNLQETAIRESFEEVGVEPKNITILGELTSLYIPVSDYLVYPFVGYCTKSPIFKLDPNEVAYTISIALNKLPRLEILETTMNFRGEILKVPYFEIEKEMVWGATSMILSEFIELLKKINF